MNNDPQIIEKKTHEIEHNINVAKLEIESEIIYVENFGAIK